MATLGRIDALFGRREQAFHAIDELKRLSDARYVPHPRTPIAALGTRMTHSVLDARLGAG